MMSTPTLSANQSSHSKLLPGTINCIHSVANPQKITKMLIPITLFLTADELDFVFLRGKINKSD